MEVIAYVVLPALMIANFFCMYMLFRNHAVHSYLIGTLNEISEAAQFDLSVPRDWKWRLDELNKVEYNDMMFQFWRPLDSFFPHRDALTNMHMTKELYERL